MAMNRQTILNKPRNTKSALCRLLSYIARYRAAVILLLILCFVANILVVIRNLGAEMTASRVHHKIKLSVFTSVYLYKMVSSAESSDATVSADKSYP